jgi:hypothetical protein
MLQLLSRPPLKYAGQDEKHRSSAVCGDVIAEPKAEGFPIHFAGGHLQYYSFLFIHRSLNHPDRAITRRCRSSTSLKVR